MSISKKTPIGAAQEISATKKGRNLNREVIEFSESYFDLVASNYWENIAPELEEELEENVPSDLEEDGLEVLEERYARKEEKLDEQLLAMEEYINGLGVEGRSNGLSLEESYTLGLNLAGIILGNQIEHKKENIFHLPEDGIDYFETGSDIPELLRTSPEPVYEVADDVQRTASNVVEIEQEIYDLDVPSEEEIIEYRQSQGSN